MELGLRMGLRDGDSTNFWQDRWIDSGESLIDSVVEDQSTIDIDQPVSAFVSASGEWNWPLFSHLLTPGARLQTPLLPWIEDFIRRPELSLLFGVTCWFLWRYRNDRVFNGKLTTAVTLTRHIQAWLELVGDTLDRDRSVTDTIPPARTEVCISWEPAPPKWVSLNSDDSVITEFGHAAAGGLIRDYQGHCLAAFSENLGICLITRAELRGDVSGLQLAWDRGFRKVQLQIDSQCAVLLL
ncbi:Putative ribonuclease H protein At1g65750 [Linum perenne]